MKRQSKWWPWKVSIFLLGATVLSYLDRQALNVVAPIIQKELSLDNAQLGLLMGVFLYSYGLMHLAVGFFLDRFNIRYVYAAFVALWSLAQMGTGLAGGSFRFVRRGARYRREGDCKFDRAVSLRRDAAGSRRIWEGGPRRRNGRKRFVERCGLSVADIDIVCRRNPARLLGLTD